AAVLALALTMASVRAQASPFSVSHPRRAAKVAGGAPETQTCVTRGGVRYCAWPAYLPWVDSRWRQPVEGVLRRVPATERRQTLTVHQMDPGLFPLAWSPPTYSQRAEMVGPFARRSVPRTPIWP